MPGKIQKFFVPPNSELWRVPRSQYQQANAGSQHADTHEKILIRHMRLSWQLTDKSHL